MGVLIVKIVALIIISIGVILRIVGFAISMIGAGIIYNIK